MAVNNLETYISIYRLSKSLEQAIFVYQWIYRSNSIF